MSKSLGIIAKRYAKALFDICEPKDLELRRNSLAAFAEQLFASNGSVQDGNKGNTPSLLSVLKNPAISPERRAKFASEIALTIRPGDEIFGNFIAILTVNNRLPALPDIVRIFSQMIESFMRALSLEITTASSLSSEEKRLLQEQIRSKVPTTHSDLISINWHTDKKIIGGMVVKAGDKVLDGSLNGSLERLGRSLI